MSKRNLNFRTGILITMMGFVYLNSRPVRRKKNNRRYSDKFKSLTDDDCGSEKMQRPEMCMAKVDVGRLK